VNTRIEYVRVGSLQTIRTEQKLTSFLELDKDKEAVR